MKKLFLSVLFLMFSVASFSQTFVKKYTSVIAKKAGVVGEWQDTSLTVVFNEKGTGDIVFYYTNASVKRFHQVGDVKEDKTNSGEGYQLIMCIDDEDGTKVGLQLFDDDTTLRVLISEGYMVEFHK
jgi:uncharacterized protein YdbL (DUF1318 family)